MGPVPRRVQGASRALFFLSAPLIAAAMVSGIAGLVAADEIASGLMGRILREIDQASLATLPPDFLTTATVQRAAYALAVAFALLGAGQLAVAIGLRRGTRWSFSAAVIGGLFVAFTCGASAIFMVVATTAQPQAASVLTLGAAVLGTLAAAYGFIALQVARGRREMRAPLG